MFAGKIVWLYTDCVVWLLTVIGIFYVWHVRRTPSVRQKWRRVFCDPTSSACATILALFFALAFVDSIHVRSALPSQPGEAPSYATTTTSLLDIWVAPHIAARERSYSAPFAAKEFEKSTVIRNGVPVRDFQRLRGAAPGVSEDNIAWVRLRDLLTGSALGGALALIFLGLVQAWNKKAASKERGKLFVWNTARSSVLAVSAAALFLLGWLFVVWPHWHVLGTDATGKDVLFTAIKSVRTAVVIGTLSTLSTLPFAVLLGIAAGYFRGWVDDAIQYVYTTISSIPSVLLIAASVLMIQVFIDKTPGLYETGLERADLRLFWLSVIIGVTGWASLARLLRAETMKVAAMEYVMAARAMAVSPWAIMRRHVLPNVVHIVLIVSVLSFSGIVLYEAVLSYVGVGVDPTMESFGSMINAASGEMSRSPAIWWNLAASFLFLMILVLSANLFAAGVRDAFDPRSNGQGGRYA